MDPDEVLKQLRTWAKDNMCSLPTCQRHMGVRLFLQLDQQLSSGATLPNDWQWTTDDRISIKEK
jgi:hypothetical protein